MRKKVLVAMSGGVDSSVSAYLLKKQGFDVAGVTMCLGIEDTAKKRPTCCGAEAIEDAKKVSRKIKIPHYVLDFSKHLKEEVIDKFLTGYLDGKTPNPCVDCNRSLKFGILLKRALSLGFHFLATGHYARIEKIKNRFYLKKAKDRKKDQSYFLYPIKEEALKNIIFPLGELDKDRVRAIAKEIKLPVHDKPQSQDICFIPDRNFRGFFSRRIDREIAQGPVITLEGTLLGKHKGACFYTIGQREGLGIGYRYPLYVLSKDMDENKLVVGKREELKSDGLVAGGVNILVQNMPKKAFAKIRYGQKEARCGVLLRNGGSKLVVIFDEAEEAVTPGQSVVLYDGDTVLGGGVIEKSIRRKKKWQ